MSKFLRNLALFMLLSLVIWLPLYFLSTSAGMSETHLLLASIATIFIFSVLFFESARQFLARISMIRIGDIAIELREAVKESVRIDPDRIVAVTLDERDMQDKAGLDDLARWVRKNISNPDKKIVMHVPIGGNSHISVPMLFFQVKLLHEFFDLRAILFTDAMPVSNDHRVLGTLGPPALLRAIDDQHRTLERAYVESVHGELLVDRWLISPVAFLWESFTENLDQVAEGNELSLQMFHQRIRPLVESNQLNYPLEDDQIPELLGQLLGKSEHIILMRSGDIVAVRTLDKIAREIAIRAIKAALQLKRES